MVPPCFHDLAFVLSANFALQQSGYFSPGQYTSPVPVEQISASGSLTRS